MPPPAYWQSCRHAPDSPSVGPPRVVNSRAVILPSVPRLATLCWPKDSLRSFTTASRSSASSGVYGRYDADGGVHELGEDAPSAQSERAGTHRPPAVDTSWFAALKSKGRRSTTPVAEARTLPTRWSTRQKSRGSASQCDLSFGRSRTNTGPLDSFRAA